eukprot:6474375-Amphidinium_carterae.1
MSAAGTTYRIVMKQKVSNNSFGEQPLKKSTYGIAVLMENIGVDSNLPALCRRGRRHSME